MESEYDMGDQRGAGVTDDGVPIRYGLLSRPGAPKDKTQDNALFTRMTPMSTPQFGRRKDGQQSERGQIVSMHPKKNEFFNSLQKSSKIHDEGECFFIPSTFYGN